MGGYSDRQGPSTAVHDRLTARVLLLKSGDESVAFITCDLRSFVGDRVREDYEGPRAVGMRAIVVTAHAEDEPRDGVPTIASLGELTSLL